MAGTAATYLVTHEGAPEIGALMVDTQISEFLTCRQFVFQAPALLSFSAPVTLSRLMGSPEIERDEPVTPAGRLFLRPEMDQIINCVIGVKNPMDVDAVKTEIANSMMLKHPRFCSLMVRDRCGREYWRKTQIDIDRHVIVKHDPLDGDDDEDEDAVNGYLADLAVSSPLSTDKPLWEIHLLTAHKCAVVRIHHALGDGISLMSLFLALFRRADRPDQLPTMGAAPQKKQRSRGRRNLVWELFSFVWYTLVYVLEFVLRSLWFKDSKTVISGGAGVELWPRKLATAKFLLEDMKAAKVTIPDATINDVLFGVISAGLSRYLDHRSPNKLQEGIQITGMAMVNLRKQPGLQEMAELMQSKSGSRWGNKFGIILLPVYYHKGLASPLDYIKKAKAMIDKKKRSLEAQFSYRIGFFVMNYLGSKIAYLLNYRIVCNTTFTISNVVGPREEITITGNPVTFIRANTMALPHAITMHMVSYAGRADMQILVAKDIVPDPKFLAKCFEEALLQMKEAAATEAKSRS